MGSGVSEGSASMELTGTWGGDFRRALLAIAAIVIFAMAGEARSAEPGEQAAPAGGDSGPAVPRYVSLKSDRINLRAGPGTEYPTSWVFRRAGLPVEVIKEFEGWRQVRDAEGVTGWVLQSFLSRRRTALVIPWELKPDSPPPQIPIRSRESESASPVAIVEAGVIANIHVCDGKWCEVSVDDLRGYVEQKKLWGVYEGEVLK